jgi:hypothetical protein
LLAAELSARPAYDWQAKPLGGGDLRRFTLACAGLLACCCSAIGGASQATAATQGSQTVRTLQQSRAIAWLGGQIYAYQRSTWRWENLMGVGRTPTEGRVLTEMSVGDIQKAVLLWKGRAAIARRRAAHPPHEAAFLCIHRFEGSWRDGSGPYYGGLQMDIGFQRTYGRRLFRTKGTADHWTPLEQMWTAEKAHRSRGFWPWPNTARYCGLI